MANKCVNISSTEFKDLVEQSNIEPIELAADISIWQEKNNTDEFPKLEDLIVKEDLDIINSNNLQATKDLEEYNYITEQMKSTSEIPEVTKRKELSQVDSRLVEFLRKNNIPIEIVNNLKGLYGEDLNALAVSDGISALVKVAQGKIDNRDLAEETASILLELLGESNPLYQSMFNKVEKSDIYNEVVSQYSEAYDGDINKIKKEAISKIIADNIINEIEPSNTSFKGFLDRWWNGITNWLNKLFKGADLTDLDPYLESARIILGQSNRGIKKSGELSPFFFYSLTTEQVDKRNKLLNDFRNSQVIPTKDGYQTLDGRKLPFRATDAVKAFYYKLFRNLKEENKFGNKVYAHKGTIVHKYLEIFSKVILKEDVDLNKSAEEIFNNSIAKIDLVTYRERVKKDLLKDEEFKDYEDKFFDLTVKQFKELGIGMSSLLKQINAKNDKINKAIGTDLKPEIFNELVVWDGKDTGGSIDLAVVYPNGAIGIYDFKSIKFSTDSKGKVFKKISPFKKDSFEVQLARYKRMLVEQYGITDFAEIRIIPLNSQLKIPYNKETDTYNNNATTFKDLEMGNFELGEQNKPYLNQIPIQEFTSSKELNKSLEKIYNEIDRVNKKLKKDSRNVTLQNRKNKLEEITRKLLVEEDLSYVFDEVNTIKNKLDTDDTLLIGDENKLDLPRLRDALEYLEILSELGSGAATYLEKDSDIYKSAYGIDGIINILKDKVLDKIKNYVYGDVDVIHTEVPFLGRMFSNLSKIDSPVFKKMSQIVIARYEEIREDYDAAFKDIDKIDKNLREFADKNGLDLFDVFKNIINQDTGNLTGKYKQEFYDLRNKAREEKDEAWLLEHLEVEVKGKGKNKKYFYTGEYAKRFEDNLKAVKEYLNKQNLERDVYNANLLEWLNNNSIEHDPNLLYSKGIFFKETPSMYNDKWKYILANQPVKDYYDMYVRYNRYFNDVTGKDISDNFIAEIRKDIIEKFTQVGTIKGLTQLRGSFLNHLEVEDYDVSTLQVDAYGKTIMNIPLLFRNKIRENLNKAEKEATYQEALKDGEKFGFKEGSEVFKARLESIRNREMVKKGREFKSIDLTKSLLYFAESAFTHKHFSETEDHILAIRDLITNNKIKTELQDNQFKRIINKLTNKTAEVSGIPIEDIEVFDKFLKNYWYGLHTQNKDIISELKKKYDEKGEEIENEDGVKISGNKALQFLRSYTGLRNLGFNAIAQSAEVINTQVSLYLNGVEGRYYTPKLIKESMSNIAKRNKKTLAIIELLEPYAREIRTEKIKEKSASKISRIVGKDLHYFGYKLSDDIKTPALTEAMMKFWGIDENGKIKKVSDIKDGKSIYDLTNYDENTGEIEIDISKDNLIKFRKMIKDVNYNITGEQTKEDINTFGLNVWGQMLMQHRSWIAGTVSNRFKPAQYDEITEQLDVGRFRVLAGELVRSGNFQQSLKSLTRFGTQVITYGHAMKYTGNKSSERATTMAYNAFIKQELSKGKDLENMPTKEEFQKLRDDKLKAAAREMSIALSFLALLSSIKEALGGEDDDPIVKWMLKNSAKLSNRGLLELSFFYSPTSVLEILKSPIASMSTIAALKDWATNTADLTGDVFMEVTNQGNKNYHAILPWEDLKRDKTPGLSKTFDLFPGLRGIISFLDIWDKPVRY